MGNHDCGATGSVEPARSNASGRSEGDDIVFYPDSGKVGVFAKHAHQLFRRVDAVDLWFGESAPKR